MLEGQQKINRHKIGTGSKSKLTVKQTGPGIITVKTKDPPPSKPQGKVRMGVGGSKAKIRHKGRVDPKAANPKDPGQTPFASTKPKWVTSDADARRGYVVNRPWPKPGLHAVYEDSPSVSAPHA